LFFFKPSKIEKYDSALEFCTEKCGEFDYFSSVNNTDYNYIECECVSKIIYGDGKYSSVAKVDSIIYYFDSETLSEISDKEVKNRIS